jgi:hypothetical protein
VTALRKVNTGTNGKAPASSNLLIDKANSGNCKQEISNFQLIIYIYTSLILLHHSDVDHSQWAVICDKHV